MISASASLFPALCERLNVRPDRKLEAHIPCPNCGKLPKPNQVHFSFSPRGARCFVCGWSGSLQSLARRLDMVDVAPVRWSPPQAKPKPPAPWIASGERVLRQTLEHPNRLSVWQKYKSALRVETIARFQFGLGVLPMTRCPHVRLTVPLFDEDGALCGMRGRRVNCPADCSHHESKWLSAGGSRAPLWNASAITPGAKVVITESAVSAALYMQFHSNDVAVATLSAGAWRVEYVERLRAARWVLVVMDNDEAGRAAAIKIAESLHNAKVAAHIHQWDDSTEPHWDLADELSRDLGSRDVN